MWKTETMASRAGVFVCPKEVHVFDTPNTKLIDAELCRDPQCEVNHIFPVEVVFNVHKEGPLEWWNRSFAPDVEVHYPDRRDIAEGEKTVQKRHLSELLRHHASDSDLGPHVPELAWNAVRFKMAKEFRTYPMPNELKRFKALVAERLKPVCKEAHDLVKVYGRVFAHLMFDRVYSKAVQRKGVEDFDKSFPLPLIPAKLSRKARRQWIVDFARLVEYSEDHSETAYRKSAILQYDKKSTKSNVPKAGAVFVERRRKATAAKKRLEDENAWMEEELQRKKTTLKALTSKIAAKTQQSAGGNDKDVIGQVRSAVRALLQRSSCFHGNPENANAPAPEDSSPELVMLTEQLKKLEQSTERLQTELAEHRRLLNEARQQKKTAAKGKN